MGRLDFLSLADDFRGRVRAELAPPAQESIADLQQHIAEDRHLTPSQMAAYRHRVEAYRRTGERPFDLLPEPPACA